MKIRRAADKDIPGVLSLLSQVLEVHAKIRPDIFLSGTTKYGREELEEMFKDDERPVYVAVDDAGAVTGYAFCQLKDIKADTMICKRSVYIDDLCVDEASRGKHIATDLFEHVKTEAKKLGCRDITLNVWEGNEGAFSFYRSMGMTPRSTTMEYDLDGQDI
ncbi:MAG: GNAT family N-acetyltransferase [Lachnospiraceae bacterium]|nr:GNAT family N-acetyltransferase [Lachnospiraceae bacterium]